MLDHFSQYCAIYLCHSIYYTYNFVTLLYQYFDRFKMPVICYCCPCVGFFMLLRWFFYALALVLLCSCVGSFMLLRWFFYALAFVLLCSCVGSECFCVGSDARVLLYGMIAPICSTYLFPLASC